MASSHTPPDPNPDEMSYIKMPPTAIDSRGTDADLVGAHCQYAYCNQLDFLPFRCQSCDKTFCLEHRTEDGHACARAGAWAARRRQAELARPAAGEGSRRMRDDLAQKKPCADEGCRAVVGTSLAPAVHCPGCNRDYCMKHRLREDHGCAGKTPIGARPSAADGARSALERLRLWGQAKREQAKQSFAPPSSSSRKQSRTAQMLAVNTLKKTAKGDAKLPPEKRVYLYVEAEASTAKAKIPKGEFFYSQDWVVGKMLDAAARSLQVQNVNNQSNDEQDKLRIFHVEGGRLLDFNENLGTALQSGNTVVLLRGVGPRPDLMSP